MGSKYSYIIKVNFRKIKAFVMAKPFLSLVGVFFLIYSLAFLGDGMRFLVPEYLGIVNVIFIVYLIFKLMYRMQTMTFDYQLLQMKILSLFEFKTAILFKSFGASVLVGALIFGYQDLFRQHELIRLIILVIANGYVNIICFCKEQTKHRNLFILLTLFVVLVTWKFNILWGAGLFAIAMVGYLYRIQIMRYHNILPYYKSVYNIYQGTFINQEIDVQQEQHEILKDEEIKQHHWMEKYYSNTRMFMFMKEISRAFYQKSSIINVCVVTIIAIVLLGVYNNDSFIPMMIVKLVIYFFMDNILSGLNKSEFDCIRRGFFYPINIRQIIRDKYLAHLCIILLPGLCMLGMVFFDNVLRYIPLILMLPLKNIIINFSRDKYQKVMGYALEFVLLFVYFI
jgi:hypothetical protein